ncbi:MAG: NUDIX domain-containing protein [Candidatus Saccharimonadales bacterium]|jgi:isopentenyldiphosphate isomerase
MKEEPVDILDEQMNTTGKTMLKSEAHKKSLRHGGAHLWIYNSKGEILLQLRHPSKVIRPNVWDVSAAGHISAGDTPEETAVREAEEELGVKVDPDKFIFIGINKVDEPMPDGWTHRGFNWSYVIELDLDLSKLKFQKGEVADIRWVPLDQFEAEINDPQRSKKYTPSRLEFYPVIIESIRKELGRHHR